MRINESSLREQNIPLLLIGRPAPMHDIRWTGSEVPAVPYHWPVPNKPAKRDVYVGTLDPSTESYIGTYFVIVFVIAAAAYLDTTLTTPFEFSIGNEH